MPELVNDEVLDVHASPSVDVASAPFDPTITNKPFPYATSVIVVPAANGDVSCVHVDAVKGVSTALKTPCCEIIIR
jgi:hypothetical protein